MFKEYLTKSEAAEKRKAIDAALGHPTKGVHIGNGPHVALSDAYTFGAPGWTESECDEEAAADGMVCVTLTDRAVALGKRTVKVEGRDVAIDMTQGVVPNKPPKYGRP